MGQVFFHQDMAHTAPGRNFFTNFRNCEPTDFLFQYRLSTYHLEETFGTGSAFLNWLTTALTGVVVLYPQTYTSSVIVYITEDIDEFTMDMQFSGSQHVLKYGLYAQPSSYGKRIWNTEDAL